MGSHRGKLSELLHNKRKSVLAINFSLLGFYTGHRILKTSKASANSSNTFLQERDGKLCPIPSLVLRLTLTNQTCLFWTTSKKTGETPEKEQIELKEGEEKKDESTEKTKKKKEKKEKKPKEPKGPNCIDLISK